MTINNKMHNPVMHLVWRTLTYGFTLIQACISNHMPSRVWDELNCPFPHVNGCTVEVWEWIRNFISHFKNGCDYLSGLELKLIHVRNKGSGDQIFQLHLNDEPHNRVEYGRAIYSLGHWDALVRRWTVLSLVQVIDYHMFGTMPRAEPM